MKKMIIQRDLLNDNELVLREIKQGEEAEEIFFEELECFFLKFCRQNKLRRDEARALFIKKYRTTVLILADEDGCADYAESVLVAAEQIS